MYEFGGGASVKNKESAINFCSKSKRRGDESEWVSEKESEQKQNTQIKFTDTKNKFLSTHCELLYIRADAKVEYRIFVLHLLFQIGLE